MSRVLVDTSVWVDHFRAGVPLFEELVASQRLLVHPFVVGELACGSLADRVRTLSTLDRLPSAVPATTVEVRTLVERRDLSGRGIGFVDAHLFASTLLTRSAVLWSRDRRLHAIAADAGVAFDEDRLH